MGKRGAKPRPVLDRIAERIDVRGPDECWSWRGRHNSHGYAVLDSTRVAHSVTRILLGLKPGDGLMARHKCDNPPCVNPAHLVAGTQLQNMADMKERGRSPRGSARPNSKLTADQIHAIRADPRSCPQIARDYNTSADLIVKIKRGKAWSHVPVEGPVVLPTRHRYDEPSERQMQILRLLQQRCSDAQIAAELYVTVGTVRMQLTRLYRKLGVNRRRLAVERGYELGYLTSPAVLQGEVAA